MINDEAFKNWDSQSAADAGYLPQPATADVDAASFMAAMEADCRERAERRKVNESLAETLKQKGNEAFNTGDYVHAVQLYTDALSHVRHWTKLYTNRAQAYLQLENFEVFSHTCISIAVLSVIKLDLHCVIWSSCCSVLSLSVQL